MNIHDAPETLAPAAAASPTATASASRPSWVGTGRGDARRATAELLREWRYLEQRAEAERLVLPDDAQFDHLVDVVTERQIEIVRAIADREFASLEEVAVAADLLVRLEELGGAYSDDRDAGLDLARSVHRALTNLVKPQNKDSH